MLFVEIRYVSIRLADVCLYASAAVWCAVHVGRVSDCTAECDVKEKWTARNTILTVSCDSLAELMAVVEEEGTQEMVCWRWQTLAQRACMCFSLKPFLCFTPPGTKKEKKKHAHRSQPGL